MCYALDLRTCEIRHFDDAIALDYFVTMMKENLSFGKWEKMGELTKEQLTEVYDRCEILDESSNTILRTTTSDSTKAVLLAGLERRKKVKELILLKL